MSSPNRVSSTFSTPFNNERKILLASRKLPKIVQEEQLSISTPSPSGSDMDIAETPDISGVDEVDVAEEPMCSRRSDDCSPIQKPLNFFNLGPNGELLDGNADAYIALGFGWVAADHPTRRRWAEFAKEGFHIPKTEEEKQAEARGEKPKEDPEVVAIIEKYYPNWRTEKRKPRSRSVSRERTPPDWLNDELDT